MNSTGTRTDTLNKSVYGKLIDQIRQSISQGQLQPGQFIGTEHKLARHAGISRNSVRRGIGLLITEGLVDRRPSKGIFVREPHVTTLTVQVVVPDVSFDQCAKIARGSQSVGRKRGALIQIYDAHGSVEQDVEFIRHLPDGSSDGAIIASLHFARFTEVLYELKMRRYPFVLVDDRLRDIDIASVVADNYGGGYAVGRKLLESGHRRIGFIGYMNARTVYHRMEGLRDAMTDAGLPLDRSLVIDLQLANLLSADKAEEVNRATRELMNRPDRPSALFYQEDQAAAFGYRSLQAMGLSIPDDVSVVGFDDHPICQWLTPPLSTVKQPSVDLGRVAMEVLLRQLAHPNEKPEHHKLPTKWIERGSVANFTENG